MANSQIEQIESLKSLELNDDSSSDPVIESTDMQSKLLHHLVEVSRMVEKRADDRATEELLKANNALINELLNAPLKATAAMANVLKNPQTALNELVTQRLADSDVDLADEKTKELFSKPMEETSKQLTILVNTFTKSLNKFVRIASSFRRSKETHTFVMGTTGSISSRKIIYLRGLTFDVLLYNTWTKRDINLQITCDSLPKNMSCKVNIETTIKNHTGKGDWTRSFIEVFALKNKNVRSISTFCRTMINKRSFLVCDLIKGAEYMDESCGLLNDGNLEIEVALQADELVETNDQPIKNTVGKEQPSQMTATETNTATDS